MRIKISHCFLSLFTILILAFTVLNSAFASEELADKDENIEEVLVSGQYLASDKVNSIKTPTPIIDVPQSLSIVTAEQIEQRGFNSVGQIIDYTPGVNNSQGEGHRDAVVFRGVRSTADFFLDGVRDDVQYYRPLYNLEQVEILRGPNALLFGRGGTGGVLNRVTKKGMLGESFTALQAGVDSFGAFDLAVDSNFQTSLNTAFRINAVYENLDNHRDFFDGDQVGINPTVKVELSEKTTLDLSYEYINQERFVDRGIPTGTDGRPVEAFENIVFGNPELNTTELTANILRAAIQHNFSDTLKGNVSAFYGDYDKAYQNFFAVDADVLANTVTLDGYIDTTQRENLILSTNLVSEFNTGRFAHTFIFGAELIKTSSNQDRFNSVFDTVVADNLLNPIDLRRTDREIFSVARPIEFNNGTGTLADGRITNVSFTDLNDDTRVNIDVASIYLQDELEISEKVDIVLGARLDSFDIEVNNLLVGDFRTRKDNEMSPRLGLIFKPQENISLYGSYSESFLPRSGEQFANINGENNDLEPDIFENSELGLKWDFAAGLSFTAAYFQNEQIRADRDNITGEGFEIRGLEVEGFELQLQGQITDRFFVTAGYTNLSGETDQGTETPRELPENTFSAWGNYDLTDRFGFGLGLTYQDDAFITDFDIGDDDISRHHIVPIK